MVKYHIKLYPRAYRDMEEIYRYIAIEKQVPENAKAQTDRIWRAIKKLETFPGSHQDRLEGKYAGKGINSFWSIIIWQFIRLMRLKKQFMSLQCNIRGEICKNRSCVV